MRKLIVAIAALVAASFSSALAQSAKPRLEVFKPNPCGPSDGIAAESVRGQTHRWTANKQKYTFECDWTWSSTTGERGTYTTDGSFLCVTGNIDGYRCSIYTRGPNNSFKGKRI